MAVRLSQEELLQDIEQLDSGEKDQLQVAPPTERGYEIVISYWDEYACRVGQPALVPNAKWMKGFFKTLATEHKGTLGPLLSVQTLTTYLTRLRTVFERDRDVKIPPQEVAGVRTWIEKDLKTLLKLSNKTRTKPVMASQDLDTLLHFLWAKDQHIFRQELTRVKLHLYLLILAYTAARTGAVIVSDAYRNSNEALLYKDLKFHLCKDEEGGPPNMSLTITFNLMKNDRDKEDESITITLWEDRAYPHLCPITFFLTLAFEHKAFDVEPEELYYATIERDVVEIKFKDAVLDTPLFRSSDGTTAWTYASCYSALTGLAYRAGYRCQVTSYAIRRGAANILDKSATWAETGLILGHKNPKVLQSKYANRHLGVNLQKLFHNRPTGNDRVRPLRTLAVEHFPGAPSDLRGTELHQDLRQHPEYLVYRQEWEYLKQSTMNKALIKAARRKMDIKLAQLRRNETKKRREAWINTDGSRYLRSQRQGEPRQETAGDSAKNNPPPWRITITELLFKSSVDQSQEERLKLFHSLQYLSIIKYGSARNESIYSCPYNDCPRRWKPLATEKSLNLHSRWHEQTLYRIQDSGYASYLEESDKSSTDVTRENSQAPTIPKKPNKTQHVCPHQHCLRHTRPFPFKRDLLRHCDRIHGSLEHYCPNQHCVRSKRPFTNERSLVRHLNQTHSQVKD